MSQSYVMSYQTRRISVFGALMLQFMHTHTHSLLQVLDSPWEGPSAASQAVWEGRPLLALPPAPPPLNTTPGSTADAAAAGTTGSATAGAPVVPTAATAAHPMAPNKSAPHKQQQQQQQPEGRGLASTHDASGYNKPKGLKGPQVELHLPSLVLDVSATYEGRAEACKDVMREFMFAIPKVCVERACVHACPGALLLFGTPAEPKSLRFLANKENQG
eukprot:1158665-Pelagomonas_calceolata.AAC.4